MIDNIITCVLSSILFVLSMILYVFVTACLLPKIFIRPHYKSDNVCDRGVKKYLFEEGRAIVYEPSQDIRQYVNQYILSDYNGKRCLQCKFDESIKKITYRVLTFSADDKSLGAFEVTENGVKDQMIPNVNLPYDTAYVSIEVKSVNGKKVFFESEIRYSIFKIVAFVLLTTIITLVETWIAKSFLSLIFRLFFDFSTTASSAAISSMLLPIITGLVLSVLVFFMHYSREYKIKK